MLETSIVGSLPKPSWLAAPGLRAPWRMAGEEMKAAQDEAVRQAVAAVPHVLLLDAAPERPQVLAARRQGKRAPDRHHREAGIAQLPPAEREAPRLDQHQQHQRAEAFRHTIDGDVDEGLGLVLDVHRQRQEQDLARGLVHRVAERGVHDPREPRPADGRQDRDDREVDLLARQVGREHAA